MSALHTLGATVLVHAGASDELVRQLTGSDPLYYDASHNTRDALVIRERGQLMWDALLRIAKAEGGAA